MKYKIFHGPVNICGQATKLSSWQKKKGVISDTITFKHNIYDPPGDYCLCLNEYSILTKQIIRFTFFLFCLFKYNLFHFNFGQSLLPLNLDLPFLKLFRKKILMTYCGSDIRLIEIEKTRNKYWKLINFGLNKPKYDFIKKIKMQWQNLFVQKSFAPRNIYAYAKTVIPEKKIIKDLWIHNAMAIERHSKPEYSTNEIPVIVHAPSQKDIKGTSYVEKAIQSLKSKGYKFEFRLIHGIPYQEAHRVFRDEADIIVDQFILGGIGQLAFEGMYYGKPVISYLIPSVMDEHFPDCPIVNATIDNLDKKIAWLLEHPEERIKLGKAGRAFVERHLDLEVLNKKIWVIYKEVSQ